MALTTKDNHVCLGCSFSQCMGRRKWPALVLIQWGPACGFPWKSFSPERMTGQSYWIGRKYFANVLLSHQRKWPLCLPFVFWLWVNITLSDTGSVCIPYPRWHHNIKVCPQAISVTLFPFGYDCMLLDHNRITFVTLTGTGLSPRPPPPGHPWVEAWSCEVPWQCIRASVIFQQRSDR